MRQRLLLLALVIILVAGTLIIGCGGSGTDEVSTEAIVRGMVVMAFNELGMHCLNRDFSKLMVLPPYNTLRAQVIRRGEEPHIVQSGVTVRYTIPSNTHSAGKTNFWDFAQQLLGRAIPPNIGITGNGLSGTLTSTGDGRYEATGIPLTPLTDRGRLNPYPLAHVSVATASATTATTKAVVPVSWELNCGLCHRSAAGTDTAILRAHDRLHGTHLVSSAPVACGRCHRQEPLVGVLGPGDPALSSLSRAMHATHANRMSVLSLATPCYACHPGVRTQCLRDVHQANGMTCTSCHGPMTAVASPSRRPWVTEPRCASCHQRAGFRFEQPGKLYRESRGHNGVYCQTCHNTPHATVPTTTPADNVQNIGLQGYAGTLNKCTVCHVNQPDEAFNHTL